MFCCKTYICIFTHRHIDVCKFIKVNALHCSLLFIHTYLQLINFPLPNNKTKKNNTNSAHNHYELQLLLFFFSMHIQSKIFQTYTFATSKRRWLDKALYDIVPPKMCTLIASLKHMIRGVPPTPHAPSLLGQVIAVGALSIWQRANAILSASRRAGTKTIDAASQTKVVIT